MPRIRRSSSVGATRACASEDCEECQLITVGSGGDVYGRRKDGDEKEEGSGKGAPDGGVSEEGPSVPFAGLLLSRLAGGVVAASAEQSEELPERERALRRTLLDGEDEENELERDDDNDDDEDDDDGEEAFPGKSEYYAGGRARQRAATPERARCRGFADAVDDSVRRRLVRATVFALIFLAIEIIGGVMANSLALLTDAAHILSDAGGFIITLYALHVSRRQPTERYSFGFHRSETIAALANILIIWTATAVLVVEAVRRVTSSEPVNGKLMTTVAGVGVLFNVIMLTVFHEFHSHGPAGAACGCGHDHSASSTAKDHAAVPSDPVRERTTNLNMKSALAHVVGDLVQSVGVLIAGIIIWINPNYRLADPICTFIFAVLVLMTTWPTIQEIFSIIMEATPASISGPGINIHDEIWSLQGIADVYCVHAWSLTSGKVAMTAHVVIDEGVDHAKKLAEIQGMLRRKFHLQHSTIQLESSRARVAAGPDELV